jgi:P-type Ca2+ transporter type 2C
VFLRQFAGMIVWVLVGAAGVSRRLQEWIDAAAIVVLNALLGFVQEYKAERSLVALKTLSVPTARVVRGGGNHGIPANRLRFTTAMNRSFAISSCTPFQDD